MKVPFLDLKLQYRNHKEEIINSLMEVLETQDFVMGRHERRLAESFNKIHGSKFFTGCSNGTSAITVALRCLGIQPGDEIITQANSFFATAEAIIEVGAKPVFVDCETGTHSISLKEVEKKITSKTKAIIPVHLYGNPANMLEASKIAKQYKLKIIEDCAQAHLAKTNEIPVGTFGEFGTFSFYPGKNLGAYGDAGGIITNYRELHELSKMHVNHGRTKKYEHEFSAGNYRIDGIQAEILNTKIKHLEEWTDKRISVAEKYNKVLRDKHGFETLQVRPDSKCVYHLFPIIVKNRDEVLNYLKEHNVGCGIHYPVPLHMQPALKHLEQKEGSYPNSEKYSKGMISLPIYPELSDEQIEYVCKKFLEIAKAAN